MIIRILLFLLVFLCASCTLANVRDTQQEEKTKVTETVEVAEVVNGGDIITLTTKTYQRAVENNQSNMDREISTPVPGRILGAAGKLGGLLGLGGGVDIIAMIAGAVGAVGAGVAAVKKKGGQRVADVGAAGIIPPRYETSKKEHG